jgi:hypothetical protein
MQPAPGFHSLGRLVLPFLLIVCALLAGLGWLGWRVLEQDRTLESQRLQDRLGTGADSIATTLLGKLVEVEDLLAQLDAAPEVNGPRGRRLSRERAGATPSSLSSGQRESTRSRRFLRYYPVTPVSDDASSARFARGEALEYRQKDTGAAITFYREAARRRSCDQGRRARSPRTGAAQFGTADGGACSLRSAG